MVSKKESNLSAFKTTLASFEFPQNSLSREIQFPQHRHRYFQKPPYFRRFLRTRKFFPAYSLRISLPQGILPSFVWCLCAARLRPFLTYRMSSYGHEQFRPWDNLAGIDHVGTVVNQYGCSGARFFCFVDRPPAPAVERRSRPDLGRVAQRESTPFTREGSQVQSLSRPPFTN